MAVEGGAAGQRVRELNVSTAATSPLSRAPVAALDVESVRADFPILAITVGGKPLVYLDNAATSQKPRVVIEAVRRFLAEENANIHRGVHYLSERATLAFDAVRDEARAFLNAPAAARSHLRARHHRGH